MSTDNYVINSTIYTAATATVISGLIAAAVLEPPKLAQTATLFDKMILAAGVVTPCTIVIVGGLFPITKPDTISDTQSSGLIVAISALVSAITMPIWLDNLGWIWDSNKNPRDSRKNN